MQSAMPAGAWDCTTKRRTLAIGLAGRLGPFCSAGLSLSRKYQKSVSSNSEKPMDSRNGAIIPTRV